MVYARQSSRDIPSSERLPSLRDLTDNLDTVPCPSPNCAHWLSFPGAPHDCGAPTGPATSYPFASGPHNSSGQNSPAVSINMMSSEVSTPASSRSPSVFGSESDTPPMCALCKSRCGIMKHMKAEQKKCREKTSRRHQSTVNQDAEDVVACYLGQDKPRKTQFSGNSSSSGLRGIKIDTERSQLHFARKYLHQERKKAKEAGREAAWMSAELQELYGVLDRYDRGSARNPAFDNSWMETPHDDCVQAEGNSKGCKQHPNSGMIYADCRLRHRKRVFEANMRAFQRAKGLGQ